MAFLVNTFGPLPVAQADDFILPAPGQMVTLSPSFSPAVLKGIKLDPKNPFRFHFFVDRGDGSLSQEELKRESAKLIKYFLTSLTIPEKDLWVNLSPYEKDRIVPQEFGQTEMGRDLLAEDYLLKQITASLIYPESHLGQKFWQKVYAQAQAKYGTTNIPINTFNKVWIVPEKAVVYENGGVAFVLENHLKVMLEQDYLSLAKHEGIQSGPVRPKDTNQLGSQIVREIVIPALTKEVNEGKNFAQLRQVFYSLILATWYKKKIKDSILNKVYSNRNKIGGVNVSAGNKDRIYQEYLRAFKKGVYNYIKEEQDPLTREVMSRKYFSGGVIGAYADKTIVAVGPKNVSQAQIADLAQTSNRIINVFGDTAMISQNPGQPVDGAMNVTSYKPDEVYVRNLRREARARVEELKDASRFKWRSAFEQVNIIISNTPVIGELNKENIDIHEDTILAYTFLSWLSQRGNLLPLKEGQILFFDTYRRFEVQATEYMSVIYQQRYHQQAQEYQFNGIKETWDHKGRQAAEKLFQIEAAESLLHLHRFGYEMPAPMVEAKEVLKVGEGVVNVGIYHQVKKDYFALARHGGADPRTNVIQILWDSSLKFERINGHVKAVATSGVVFKNDRPYFVQFEQPVVLDYVVNFDQQLAGKFAKEGIPTASHKYSDEYMEEKDIANRILRAAGVHVPKTVVFIGHRSVYDFINKRRDNTDDVVNIIGYKKTDLKRRIRLSLINFLHSNNIEQAVIKPNRDTHGNGVMYFEEQTIEQAIDHIIYLNNTGQNVIVQERIVPLLADDDQGQPLDWNAREFVARDEHGEVKVSDRVLRVGQFGRPINGHKGAFVLTLEDMAHRLKLTPQVLDELKKNMSAESVRAYEAIYKAMAEDGLLRPYETATDSMGTDDMVRLEGEKLVPYLIEVNNFNSGGGWYLDNYLQLRDSKRVGVWAKYWIETMVQRGSTYRQRTAIPIVVSKVPGTTVVSKTSLKLKEGKFHSLNEIAVEQDGPSKKGKGGTESRAMNALQTHEAKAILAQIDSPYQFPNPRASDMTYFPFKFTFKTVEKAREAIVSGIQRAIKHAAFTAKGLDANKIIFEIGGTAAYLKDPDNGSIYWPGVDDIDIFVFIPDEFKLDEFSEPWLLNNIEAQWKKTNPPKDCHITILSMKDLIEGVKSTKPFRPDNLYFGDTQSIREIEEQARISSKHKAAVLQEYYNMFTRGNIGKYLKIIKKLFQMALLRGDKEESRKLFGLIKQVVEGKSISTDELMLSEAKAMPDPVKFREDIRDAAMKSEYSKQLPGGIDLNPVQMNIQVKKEGEDFKFDFNGTEIDAAQVTGATFTIGTMTPVTNLPQELGLNLEPADKRKQSIPQLASV